MSAERLVNLLGAAAVAVGDRLDEAVTRIAGLKGEAPAALLTVGTRPGRPIEQLRRALGLSHSGTVRLVDRLERRGWVRRRSRRGGREVHLELTAEGGTVFAELLEARRAALEDLLAPVPEQERVCLERALASVLGGLPADRDDARRICRLCEHAVCRGSACPVGSAVGAAAEEAAP
ncbi:MAG: MarR family transcriptional regulator [Gemmatimonadota bacterium]